MFHKLVEDSATVADRLAIVSSRKVTWAELAGFADAANRELAGYSRKRLGLIMRPDAPSLACLAALDRLKCDVFLINPNRTASQRIQFAERFRLEGIIDSDPETQDLSISLSTFDGADPGTGESTVTITTSGTSGTPKAARHTWDTLFRPAREGAVGESPVWLLSYGPHLYAGLQVVCQSMIDHGTLVAVPSDASPKTLVRLIVDNKVSAASGTPSFWRRLLMLGDRNDLRKAQLRFVALGGEASDQHVLDLLRGQFPLARIVHIYASTEMGRCFSVADGQAGFPIQLLRGTSKDGIEMRIVDGELQIRSRNAMRAYDQRTENASEYSDWFATGDLVRIEGDRVHFTGRKTDIINVGGHKVHPLEVEDVVRTVKGVRDTRVFPKTSSVAGQLVACEIVIDPGRDPAEMRNLVLRHCGRHLTSYQRPRLVQVVDSIRRLESGKTWRSKSNVATQ